MLDKIYDFSVFRAGDKPLPLVSRLEIALHVVFCSRCAGDLLKLETVRELMVTDFFPQAPDLENVIMDRIYGDDFAELPVFAATPEVPLKGWVVIGLIIVFSLATSFFGMDFVNLVKTSGISFLLPLGITIGVIITVYGALFIGTHLKELSDRFGLH
jgi:hypothetical protein